MSKGSREIEMVDISSKKVSLRKAIAYGEILLKKETIKAIKEGKVKKGDVLSTAKIASALAVKSTPNMIPLCHQIPISNTKLEFEIKKDKICAKCEVKAEYKTGVEIESLVGLAIGLITIWDMVKYLEKEKDSYPKTAIQNIKVLEKKK
ncbi:MAG: cyclic pyranopterin monophosphate synthase MoaC [Candidatus Thermoplasmatota archaeon]